RLQWRNGPNTLDLVREMFAAFGGLVLADTAGGRDQLRTLVPPELRDIVDRISSPYPAPALTLRWHGPHLSVPVDVLTTTARVHDTAGRCAGTALISKPRAGMAILATAAVGIDLRHLAGMQHGVKAAG